MNPIESNYTEILQHCVAEIRTSRLRIARQVNVAAMDVYWNLGKLLSDRKIEKGHGASVVKRLSADLKTEFPDMGLSPRNLWDMKRFYEQYARAPAKLRQAVAVLPWKHNLPTGGFKPEYIGKMNFYLGLLDKFEKHEDEHPSIGIILCADKDHLDVEIALQDVKKPIGVAEYKLLLPAEELKAMLMTELKNIGNESLL